jgi:hypothetical protein
MEMMMKKKYLPALIIVLISIAVIALPSCSGLSPDSDLGEYKVPDTYTNFKDKNGLFSISYPPEWKIDESRLSALEAESESFNEYLKDNNSPNVPQSKHQWLLFIANSDNKGVIIVSATSIVKEVQSKSVEIIKDGEYPS